jgi:hypothetical protein
MLAYGTDGLKWTTAEKRARIAVIRIIAGLKRKTK